MTTQADLETSLSQLVSIPSVSSNAVACREVIDFVKEQFEAHGYFITSRLDTPHPWFIATTKDTREPDILLAAHLDVVPASTDMFTMQKIDGKLIGRGTYDMKLAAACYLELLKNRHKELAALNIGFLFSTDEELGGSSMIDILETGLRPKIVFIPDGGGDWKIEQRAKGFYNVEIIAKGKASHGSRPWEGDNALHKLLDVTEILRKSFPFSGPDNATLAVNELHAGTAINQVADYASVKIDFRSFNKDDLSLYHAQVEQLAAKYNLEVIVRQSGQPLEFDENSPLARDFLVALRNITGKDAEFVVSYGGSDARYFAEYGIPSIIIEPRGGGRHAPDEWLLADDLFAYYQLLENWILGKKDKKSASIEFANETA